MHPGSCSAPWTDICVLRSLGTLALSLFFPCSQHNHSCPFLAYPCLSVRPPLGYSSLVFSPVCEMQRARKEGRGRGDRGQARDCALHRVDSQVGLERWVGPIPTRFEYCNIEFILSSLVFSLFPCVQMAPSIPQSIHPYPAYHPSPLFFSVCVLVAKAVLFL